jgi:hypothetical protein
LAANDGKPGCLAPFLRLFGIGAAQEAEPVAGPLPYLRRDDFLTQAELSFYQVLAGVVGGEAVICPKVGLMEIFFVPGGREIQGYFSRIAQKHVDFVLCDPATMQVLAGVELDDASHARADRQERDAFVEEVFATTGLPLLRLPARASYAPAELAGRVAPVLKRAGAGLPAAGLNAASGLKAAEAVKPVAAKAEATPAKNGCNGRTRVMELAVPVVAQMETAAGSAATVPICPKCGIPMVERTAKRGDHAGEPFYGCVNYPRCRETRQMA